MGYDAVIQCGDKIITPYLTSVSLPLKGGWERKLLKVLIA